MGNTLPYTLFISDLHLNDQRNDLVNAFSAFCETEAAAAESLYILGDLSDAWVGDDDDSSLAALIRDKLSALSSAGTNVFLMPGNRDFLMGEQLANDCQLTLLPDPTVIDLYGEPVLIMHGDSLCTRDTEYMAFRKQIQNKATQQMLLDQPLQKRREIAAMLRSQSKSANSNKAEDIMDVTPDEVLNVMTRSKVNTLIHGHTHRPAEHELDINQRAARRLVLGDWNTLGWYIKADATDLTLNSFAL